MNMHLFILLWIGALAFFTNSKSFTVSVNVLGEDVRRTNLWIAVIMFLPIFLLASLGKPMADVPAYLRSFGNLPDTFSGLIDKLSTEDKEHGFLLLGGLVKLLFGNNPTAYRLIIATIQSVPLILIWRKYSSSYSTSVFLFVASTTYLAWMMNGLRQFIAVTIIFAATPLLLKRKYIKLILVILLAYTFHSTAIIMIPIVFIVQGKAWNKKTVAYIFVAIIAMYLFGNYTGLLDSLISGTDYTYSISQYQSTGDDGTNPIRVLVNSVPAILAFLGRKQIKNDNDPIINICTNMSIITIGLYLISMTTSGILLGRLPIYTSLYGFILLPYLLDRIFDRHSAKIMKFAMVSFYLLYYYYQMHFISRLI